MTYLSTVNLADALEKGAPEGSLPYLELLADAMEDGVLTIDEQAALSELATAHQLSADQVTAAHRAYLRTIATVALNDGVVTRAERAELLSVADLLDLDQSVVRDVVDQAERERNARLSQGLKSLPPDWAFGEPLHVGDKIVFTRCDADLREQLEARAEALGVRVVNSVSGRTAMLITDDTMDGTKAAEARLHHTRQVHPRDFAVMLDFLQPATSKPATPVHVHAIGTTPDASSDPFVATTSVTPAVIREWAHDNGLPVGERGRLSADLVDAFLRTAATEGSAGLTAYHSDIAATTSTQTHGGTAVSQGTGQHATGLVRGLDGDTQDAIEQPSSEPVTVDRRPTATSLDVTPASPVLPPANWYPDPHGVARLRYWDGGGWTDHTAPW